MKLSELATSLIGSEIVKLGNAINERISKGETIYNYTIGDFNPEIFPIPAELENLIIEAYKKNYTSYPPAEGLLSLRKAVSQFIFDWEGLIYETNEIQIASGGRPLIYTLFKTIVDKDDTVIYAAPSWNNNHYTHITSGKHCIINCSPENNFMPSAEDIKPYINDATLLCLCTPQNPTGTTLSKEALTQICDLVIQENNRRSSDEKKLYVMFDQMYWTLTYGYTIHYNPVSINAEMKKYTIFIDGISKAFAATGVRVGWAMGPSAIIAKMKALLSHIGAWAPMAEQHAVGAYLDQKTAIKNHFFTFKKSLEERLHGFYNGFIHLKKMGYDVDAIAPQAAIYLTIQLNLKGKKTDSGVLLANQSDVTDYILSEAKLAVVPFSAFGAEKENSWYRLSVGTSKISDINIVINKLKEALQKLQ